MVVGPDDFDDVCTHENISIDNVFVRTWDVTIPTGWMEVYTTDKFELFVIVSCNNCDETQEQELDLEHSIYDTRYRWKV